MIFSILIPITIIGAGLIITLIDQKVAYLNSIKERYNLELKTIWCPYQSFADATEAKAYQQKVIEMPQLTFDRWLTFYNNKPECWVIQKDQWKSFADIPYYVKINEHEDRKGRIKRTFSFVPTYWISPEEKQKYRKWVETQYEYGKAQVYENARNVKLKELVGYIEEDINERRKVFEKELEKAKSDMTLQLSDGTKVVIPQPTKKQE